jgi:CHAT domain-containing protein
VLQAYEIYRLPLSRLRLVILSACRSGVERYYGGEGMVGVSRPFIAKGVPLVVASLWEVDPEATTKLMIRFHEYRKPKTLLTAEALRMAQLSLLHGSDSSQRQPYYWASFESIGGYANY